ncbi:hypothetical protein [Providencia rettgeri]|uniref:hypothetical protein n=1 Tax=Providencia rettgeri TaxID=587 RepID=UPI0034E09B87
MDNFNFGAYNLPLAQGNIFDNDELPSDASPVWHLIKEWFPLKAEPLAYQCLDKFFHGEQLMSEPEQLENFLTLRLLASPGHQNHFMTEYVESIEAAECTLTSSRHNFVEVAIIPLSKAEYHAILAQYSEKNE